MLLKLFYINENSEARLYGISFTTKDLIGFLSNEDEDGALSGVSTGNMTPYCVLASSVLETL